MKIVLTVLCLISLLPACSHQGKRIPADDFQLVLRDMFMTDVILEQEAQWDHLADSTMVYIPILEKHGYTADQFLATLDYYIGRPSRYKSLLTRLRNSMNAERTEYNERMARIKEKKVLVERFNHWLHDTVPSRHDFVLKQSLQRILAPDSSLIHPWRADTDSLYKERPLRVLPVIDTLTYRDTIPIYLVPPHKIKLRNMLNIQLD
ncbi:MAG: DUF4296 domain-containing protein [Bacteroidales bacterium]|jgi:hypothetical protein|nr:DUF4296 domain-containing protein [Bacteroidales bacterium]MDD2264530.1 DUF4296 domain-containing protein [Bacteroidales bacterium]MDD2831765.1 DUF4296 domain-containing protein [Bacteroidales bacterium]MDD3209409.1 DUF4296 domain-containing protein [Bacteroidales bacterium]MDD3697785.1 DUF4296 domain-containing protein [Bacteroidales bacterium]